MLKKGLELPEHPEFRSFSVFSGLPGSEFVARAAPDPDLEAHSLEPGRGSERTPVHACSVARTGAALHPGGTVAS